MNYDKEFKKAIIKWYSFPVSGKILCIGRDNNNQEIKECLIEMGMECTFLALKGIFENMLKLEDESYDSVVIIDSIEYSNDPEKLLDTVKKKIKKEGVLLIGADNRLGIRYFCGDRDQFTGRNFDGIENYLRVDPIDQKKMYGRSFSKSELRNILLNSGFNNIRFYSVFPALSRPQIIVAEDYIPNEELNIRIFPHYNYPDTVFLEEEGLYSSLIKEKLFHVMANGFFIECPLNKNYSNIFQISLSMDRGPENAMSTIIRRDNYVEKRALYQEGRNKLDQLLENNEYLKNKGIQMVDSKIENDTFITPYIDGISLVTYFRELLESDKGNFLKEIERLWGLIKKSSEHVPYDEINWELFEPGSEKRRADDPNRDKWKKIAFGTQEEKNSLGLILKRGYIDLVLLNGFYKDSEFIFFDQEMYVENLPAKAILLRNIDFIYQYNKKFELILPRAELLRKYDIDKYQDLFYKYIWDFLNKLRNEEKLYSYNNEHRRNLNKINTNRQRMNYSEEEYNNKFRDIFHQSEGRKIYLFGSGKFAKMFISQFGKDYNITGIFDNQEIKWGTKLEEIPIMNPEFLKDIESSECKVIVCIKNYIQVVKQLEGYGIKNFSIYDIGMRYPRKIQFSKENITDKKKKYNIGYVAGVFDLFHIGHLNLLKKAKEQCNYLITGVVSDEGVHQHKRSDPQIPFEERIEIVRACKYVDEAVEIPLEYGSTDEAYRRYQFDVQFSGSDYQNDPEWEKNRDFLRSKGSELVFFPYTESTSSTKLKAMIDKKLI